jgi:hypothetical protein
MVNRCEKPKIVVPQEDFIVNDLFEDAEFFLQEAKKLRDKDAPTTRRYVRASIITSFAAVEAFLNARLFLLLDEGTELELVERAFIQEKRLELTEDGYFDMRGQKLWSPEEKIRFLYWRKNGVRIPKGNVAWESFVKAQRLRNELVHPKPGKGFLSKSTPAAAESCLKASMEMAKNLGWTEEILRLKRKTQASK